LPPAVKGKTVDASKFRLDREAGGSYDLLEF
jgi:hypothetical protein